MEAGYIAKEIILDPHTNKLMIFDAKNDKVYSVGKDLKDDKANLLSGIVNQGSHPTELITSLQINSKGVSESKETTFLSVDLVVDALGNEKYEQL